MGGTAANGVSADGAAGVTAGRLADLARFDGWEGLADGRGTSRDKTRDVAFSLDRLPYQRLRDLWRGDDMAARAVERTPEEMLRRGYKVATGDAGLDRRLRGLFDDIGLDAALCQALKYERAYGGGAAFVCVDDGQDLDRPIDVSRIASVGRARPLSSGELHAVTWNHDTRSPSFGLPEVYGLSTTGESLRIHRSRLLLFAGRYVDEWHRREMQGWGDGVLQRMHQVLADFNLSWRSAAVMFADGNQAVMKVQGLAELIGSGKSEIVRKRVEMFDYARSVVRMGVIDSEEDFIRLAAQFGGVAELLRELSLRLAAAADMPATLLLGMSPAGLNATGESDIRGYYGRCASAQATLLKPQIERAVRWGLRVLTGSDYAGGWQIEFEPLWEPDEIQKADIRLKGAQTAQLYVDMGAATADDVADSPLLSGEKWANELRVNSEARRRYARVRDEGVQADASAESTRSQPSDLESTALNGAQVQAALTIVQQVASRALPRETGIGMLQAFFQLSRDRAELVMGDVGRGFFSLPAPEATL